jgi:hypothetical protein
MVRFAVLAMVLLVLAGSGVARADVQKKTAKVERWEQVERLKPGEEINVLAGTRSAPDLCLVASVDDNALTCLAEDVQSETRLVFPRSTVQDVWVIEKAPGRHVVFWIAVAVTAVLEISACVSSGFSGCATVGIVLAVMWGSAAIAVPWGEALGQLWPQRPPRMRKRLVYEAPATP